MNFNNYYLDEDINGYESVYDMWLDQKVTHVTPVTKERNRVKIKSLTPEERNRYLYLLDKLKQRYGRDSDLNVSDQNYLSNKSKIRVNDPLGNVKDPKFIDTMYYSGNRDGLEFNEFEKGKLTVTTNDSSLSLNIEEKGDKVCIARNVPVSSIKAYKDKTGEWVEYTEMSQQEKYDRINFAKNTVFLADFYTFKMYIKFEESDKDVTDADIKKDVVEERNDLEVNLKAKKLADNIIKFIKKWKNQLNEILVKSEKGSFLFLPVKVIDEEHPNLFVAFGKKGSRGTTRAGFQSFKNFDVIRVYCLENNGEDTPVVFNYKNISDELYEIRDDLIHELIHYLDNKKYNLNDVANKIKNSEENYFNLPHEYNAMYHEGISQVIDNLKQSDVLKNIFLNNFNKFRDYMWGHIFRNDFVKFTSSDIKRKIDKRLYSVWQELKQFFDKKKKKV